MFLMLSLILVQKINFNIISTSKREFSHKIALYDCFQFIYFHSKKTKLNYYWFKTHLSFLKLKFTSILKIEEL